MEQGYTVLDESEGKITKHLFLYSLVIFLSSDFVKVESR